MKISTNQARNFRPTISKIMMALTLASVMGGISVTPALARDNDRRDERGRREQHSPVYRHPYNYSRPVYAPPPVYYAPQQSPGISFFLPLDIRRR